MTSNQEIRHPDKQANTGHYSAGVLVDGWLFISGQGPVDLKTGEVIRGTVEEQTRTTLGHIDKILRAGGCGPQDVVKCACHLADVREFDGFNRAYAEYFRGPVLPARTTVQSALAGGNRVVIDAVARVPPK